MIAFLVFLTVMAAFIVGSVCISMYLYKRSCTPYPAEHQLVTLNQEAFLGTRPYKQRRGEYDMGMSRCVRNVVGVSLAIVAGMLVLILAFLNASF